MNASATQQVKVGDKAIFCNGDKAPVETTIVRVTPKGWIRIADRDQVSYKPTWGGKYEVPGDKWDKTTVYLHTESKMAALVAEHENHLKNRAEQQAERDRKLAERDARLAAELATVKGLCENDLATVIHGKIMLPNGDRLVTMFAPVNPKYADRKAGRDRYDSKIEAKTEPFEVVICRLVNRNERDWVTEQDEPRVECYMTYCNGGNQSFPSCSGDQQKTDEDCLWEALRHVYYSW